MNMANVEMAKFRSFSRWKSTTGSFCRSSQTTTEISATTAITVAATMPPEENQSFRWPSSSVISSAPSPVASSPRPM